LANNARFRYLYPYSIRLCQYHDDPQLYKCATDQRQGLVDSCSRVHARIWTAVYTVSRCASSDVQFLSCVSATTTISTAMEWTLACFERFADAGPISCSALIVGANGCFSGNDNPSAKMTSTEFKLEVAKNITYTFQAEAGTGGSGGRGGGGGASGSPSTPSSTCAQCLNSCHGYPDCCSVGSGCICRNACMPTSCSKGLTLCCDAYGDCICVNDCPY
jgi:hypothetical protein